MRSTISRTTKIFQKKLPSIVLHQHRNYAENTGFFKASGLLLLQKDAHSKQGFDGANSESKNEAFSSESFRDWGAKNSTGKAQKEPDDYSVKEIKDSMETAKDDWLALSETPKNVIAAHNRTIANISESALKYKFFIFTRSDSQKTEMIISEIKKIYDFYNALCNSQDFLKMEHNLAAFINTIRGSKQSIQAKITKIGQDRDKLNGEIQIAKRRGSDIDQIQATALETCVQCKESIIKALTEYQKTFDKLDQKVKDADKAVEIFCATVKANVEVLFEMYNTLVALRDIQKAMDCTAGLKEMQKVVNGIQTSWNNLDVIVRILGEGVEHQIKREMKTEESKESKESKDDAHQTGPAGPGNSR